MPEQEHPEKFNTLVRETLLTTTPERSIAATDQV